MKISEELMNTDESVANKSDDNDGHGYKWIADTTGNKLSNVNSSKGPAHAGTFERMLKSFSLGHRLSLTRLPFPSSHNRTTGNGSPVLANMLETCIVLSSSSGKRIDIRANVPTRTSFHQLAEQAILENKGYCPQ